MGYFFTVSPREFDELSPMSVLLEEARVPDHNQEGLGPRHRHVEPLLVDQEAEARAEPLTAPRALDQAGAHFIEARGARGLIQDDVIWRVGVQKASQARAHGRDDHGLRWVEFRDGVAWLGSERA